MYTDRLCQEEWQIRKFEYCRRSLALWSAAFFTMLMLPLDTGCRGNVTMATNQYTTGHEDAVNRVIT